ncbi:MAG: 3-methyl-2-oxobutanoate dehydrogenase subunit VorB [Candidatus Omnitrophota bacterium]
MYKVLMRGNEAVGEATVMAGCRFYAGYPITPQNELTAYMAKRMPEVGGVFIQAESEIAAISMIFGASGTGERVMTSSSSPGISLKQEGISYMAGCELPAVIINMSRGGPGLGNIGPSQSDYFQAVKGGGHGDYKLIVLAPASVQEFFDLTVEAFDLADKYRMQVMILGDGMLGQMMEPLILKKPEIKEYKKDWVLGNCKGRKPRAIHSLFLGKGALDKHNQSLQKKYALVKKELLKYKDMNSDSCDLLLVAFGSMGRLAKSAMNKARAEGLKVGLIRPITLWPFPEKVIYEAAGKVKKILTIEMNYGQMIEDVKLASAGRCEVDFLGRGGGEMLTEKEILSRIKEIIIG